MVKNFNQLTVFVIIIFTFFSCNNNSFKLEQGDLLFQNTGTDAIDNAIKKVTATALAKNYSHVGMALQENKQWFIIEAIPKKGVCKTPLKVFLNRHKNSSGNSQTAVARLKKPFQKYIPKAIAYGQQVLNRPYDAIFLWDDNSFYCSELIYKMFSKQGLPKKSIPFLTHPMTFNDSTGNPLPSWEKYYKVRNQPIPEGMEGTNPNLMASSKHITFIYDYERPK